MSEKAYEDSVAVRYMKLVAEVHQDIANLKNGNEEKGIKPYRFDLPDSNGKHGTYLFNNSPAIRKLVVFLATENLDNIEMKGHIKNKSVALLQMALQPQLFLSCFLKKSINMKSIESLSDEEQKKTKVGFNSEKRIIHFNEDNVFGNISGSPTGATKTVSNLLTGIVEAVKSDTEKNEAIKKSLTNEDGMAKDLVELSDETKKNIRTVLGQCLGKKDPENKTKISFVLKVREAWNSFLVFIGCRKPKVKQNNIIPKETKDGMGVLSNFLASANKSDDIKNRSVK